MKKLIIILIIILISTSISLAQTSISSSYILTHSRIVVSGGSSISGNYTLSNVSVGNIFGGSSSSTNYTLDVNPADRNVLPCAPVLDPVVTPTNNPVLALSGTKESNTSICINGTEEVSLSSETTWSCDINLEEGENILMVTAKNTSGLESNAVIITITLDTVPPFIVIEAPLDKTIATASSINVEGTIDGVSFTEVRDLSFGFNEILIDSTDESGNTSSETIEVYLVREPIPLP